MSVLHEQHAVSTLCNKFLFKINADVQIDTLNVHVSAYGDSVYAVVHKGLNHSTSVYILFKQPTQHSTSNIYRMKDYNSYNILTRFSWTCWNWSHNFGKDFKLYEFISVENVRFVSSWYLIHHNQTFQVYIKIYWAKVSLLHILPRPYVVC